MYDKLRHSRRLDAV
jgi:serine/threonine protein phosphatase PrpC